MNITVTGATGFIGRPLVERLAGEGHRIHVLSRSGSGPFASGVQVSPWNPLAGEPPPESLAGAGAVIHLAGEPVAQRWTQQVKQRILDSRVQGTRRLVQGLSTLARRPEVLVCASAVGIYGDRGDEVLTESSATGAGFLADVCRAWEDQADLAESLGMRVVKLRIGVVLGKGGGALKKMLPPFRAFVGGKVGGGRQWMPWIHLQDLIGLVAYCVDRPLAGVVNGTAPEPVRNEQFTAALGRALARPAILPVPAFALKAVFGEMAEVLLASQRVVPRAALDAGYPFTYPTLEPALRDAV
jgi:uncharacterized protein (TIGR01777 family)